MSKLNPCPICGSEVESNISFGTAQINCKNHDCIMVGCIMMNEPFVDEIEKKWNDSYSSQQLAKLKCVNDKYLDIIQAKNMNESFLESEIMSLKKQLELERLEKEKAIKEAEVLMLTLEIDEGSPMDVWLKKYGSKK